MRDPARIPRILALLEQRWKEAPDQRLGQLVVNFAESRMNIDHGGYEAGDPFYVEDDVIEASLERGWEQFKS